MTVLPQGRQNSAYRSGCHIYLQANNYLQAPSLASKIVSTFARGHAVARVNILRQVRTDKGWRNAALPRKQDGPIKWPSNGRYLIEWRENGRRVREAAGTTLAEALEAQKRKRLELDARATGLSVLDPEKEAEADALPLAKAIHNFLQDIRTFRKPMTYGKYEHVLELFAEHVAPKSDPLHRSGDPAQFLRQARH
jgi:hypothetical protein